MAGEFKQVVSVSLGSSRRDHEAKAKFLGYDFILRRVGTDGNFKKAQELLADFDGKVDAIGLGGIDVYLYSRSKRYALRDGLRLMQIVKNTPVVDGSGLKNTLERETIRYLSDQGILDFKGAKVLMVCAMDRFGMAEALEEVGANVVYGDMIFSLGIDKPITSLDELEDYAEKLLPEVCKLPISMVYPVGNKQKEIEPKEMTNPYYEAAEIIAGDFHFIRRRMPSDLKGKVVITNTVTERDVKELKKRGVRLLVTTTPELEGRSFGTNVLEAVFITLVGKPWDEVQPEDYLKLISRLDLKPRIVALQAAKA